MTWNDAWNSASLRLTILGWAVIALMSTAAARQASPTNTKQPSRWAIVASPELREAGVSDLLVVELSSSEGIELVEREAIDRVQQELELTAAGLVDPNKAVQLGKLLAADVMVFLETEPALGGGVSRIRLVETLTGVRLLDRISEHGPWKTGATQLLADFRDALRRVQTPDDKRRYVGVLDIQSEEASRSLDAAARAITALLQRDLARSQATIVLEREQLQRLTQESDLTGIDLKLRGSTVLVAGSLGRSEENRLTVTLKLAPLGSGEPSVHEVTGPASDLGQLRELLVGKVRSELDLLGGEPAPADLQEESRRFAQAWARHVSHERYAEGLAMAETALALDPSPENYELLYGAYSSAAKVRYGLGSMIEPALDRLRWHIRAQEIDCQCIERYGLTRAMRERQYLLVSLFAPLDRRQDPRPREAQRDEATRLQRELRELCFRKYRLLFEQVRREHGTGLPLKLALLRNSHMLCDSTEEFVKVVQRQVEMLEGEMATDDHQPLARYYLVQGSTDEVTRAYDGAVTYAANGGFRFLRRGPPGRPQLPPHFPRPQTPAQPRRPGEAFGPEGLQPLWDWLAGRDDPVLRAIGLGNSAWAEEGDARAELAYRMLDAFREAPLPSRRIDWRLDSHPAKTALELIKQNGEWDRWLGTILDQAETNQDLGGLVRWPAITRRFLAALEPQRAESYGTRIASLVEAGCHDPDDWRNAWKLRQLMLFGFGSNARDPGSEERDREAQERRQRYRFTPLPLSTEFNRHDRLWALEVDKRDPHRDDDDELILIIEGSHPNSDHGKVYRVVRERLSGGSSREVTRFESPQRPTATCTALGSEGIFVGTKGHGFFVIKKDGAKRYDAAEGAPGDSVSAMAALGSALYVADPGVVARFDLGTEKFKVLASSRRAAPRHDLDGGTQFDVKSMIGDQERNCLWLSIVGRGSRQRDGVWKHPAGSERFERVFHTAQPDRLLRLDGAVFFETWVHSGSTLPKLPGVIHGKTTQAIALLPGEDRFALTDSIRYANFREIWRTFREPPVLFDRSADLVHYDGRRAVVRADIHERVDGQYTRSTKLILVEMRHRPLPIQHGKYQPGTGRNVPHTVGAEEGVVRWVGDVNTVWTANRDGDTNWNKIGTMDGILPGPDNIARFDGTLAGSRLPATDDLRSTAGARDPLLAVWRTIEVSSRVEVRRIDFYDVAAGLKQNGRLRLFGRGPLELAGDADGLAIDVTWKDTSDQGIAVRTDILVSGNVRFRRRAVSNATGGPVLRNRNRLYLDGTIGESVPGCRVEFDNEDDLDPCNPNHYPRLTINGDNSYSGGTILNGDIRVRSETPFGTGRLVDVATRRNSTLEVACNVGSFSNGTRTLEHDFRLPHDDDVDRTFRIRNLDCGDVVLAGSIAGGDPGDVLELMPSTNFEQGRRITLTGKNTCRAKTIIWPNGTVCLTGSLACGNIVVGDNCTLKGDPDRPGTIAINISDDACDRIVLEGDASGRGGVLPEVPDSVRDRHVMHKYPTPNRPGGLLDARNLVIEIRTSGPLSGDSYVLVDYSTPCTGLLGSDNPATNGTFAEARAIPEGYALVHDLTARQVLLERK